MSILGSVRGMEDTQKVSETEEECAAGCGYFSSGRDLLEHQEHEHVRCPDCGRAPAHDDNAVSHKPDCPRLQPGYRYPGSS
jgi:hypothetical protein